ncbi:HAD family hydrolase [Erysipelothrix sp. HDW6C]|uniref:HAD family hydrolase n=1 Tax=Erysipelothrix sp. HDW6C TaxID=2714930 RepID=UPI001408D078|nr:HAD family hydrolase [Erysipelothrix sp. HDW6C]QIK69154.1 HAD family hydrolase [Erysipelothrix sp. HDW6C]
MKYDAIIYDIDGTILNTFDMNVYPLMRILKEELGIDYAFDELVLLMSTPGLKILKDYGVEDHEVVYKRWVKYVNEYEGGATIYENFDEVLALLHHTYKQGIVSAKMRDQYHIDFVSKDLHNHIDAEVLSDDTTKHKPDPDPLLLCMEKLGVTPDRCIYIGDSIFDYEAANAAGCDFGLAGWGNIELEGIDEPTYVFNQPQDIVSELL